MIHLLKYKGYFFLVGLFMTTCFACNRNSNQLSPVTIVPVTLVKTCSLYNVESIDVIFYQTKTNGHDTISITCRNLTGRDLTNVKVLIEMCAALPQNYDNCDLQTVLQFDSIKANDTTVRQILFYDRGITLNADHINVGIIAMDTSNYFINGVYNSSDVEFNSTNAHPAYYGRMRGYVFADGNATFRIKGPDSAYYDVVGTFTGPAYSGSLIDKNDDIISTVTLDTLSSGTLIAASVDSLSLDLNLKTPLYDSIGSVLINAKK